MEENERVHECEECGHAYTKSYGCFHWNAKGAVWRCHKCTKRLEQEVTERRKVRRRRSRIT